MKTSTLTLTAAFAFMINMLFAGNNLPPVMSNDETSAALCLSLEPVIPPEASFSEVIPNDDICDFQPETPATAGFDETVPDPAMPGLAPVVPTVAGFGDQPATTVPGKSLDLKPVVPKEASFEK